MDYLIEAALHAQEHGFESLQVTPQGVLIIHRTLSMEQRHVVDWLEIDQGQFNPLVSAMQRMV